MLSIEKKIQCIEKYSVSMQCIFSRLQKTYAIELKMADSEAAGVSLLYGTGDNKDQCKAPLSDSLYSNSSCRLALH